VQTDGYLLVCIRYIELNPVRARMVAALEQYARKNKSVPVFRPRFSAI